MSWAMLAVIFGPVEPKGLLVWFQFLNQLVQWWRRALPYPTLWLWQPHRKSLRTSRRTKTWIQSRLGSSSEGNDGGEKQKEQRANLNRGLSSFDGRICLGKFWWGNVSTASPLTTRQWAVGILLDAGAAEDMIISLHHAPWDFNHPPMKLAIPLSERSPWRSLLLPLLLRIPHTAQTPTLCVTSHP
jgi:hypothetical protein